MKDVIKDIIKWGVIIIIGAGVFYVVCPKYEIIKHDGDSVFRYNKITGLTERWMPLELVGDIPLPSHWKKLEENPIELQLSMDMLKRKK